MDLASKNDNKLFQNSIKYLHSISNMGALNVPALKSFYSTKRRLMELRNAVYLPFNITKTSVSCQRCFTNLLDGPATHRIKAEQKKNKFAKRVLAKFHHDKPLTQFQRKYIKKLDNFNGNQLSITCKFCKKESLIKLEKPKKPIGPKATKKEPSKKKKKLKKKDKFCGLNEDAVKSLTPQNIRNLDSADMSNRNDKKVSGFKLSKKKSLMRKKVNITVENTKENMVRLKKKNKKLDKLNQILLTKASERKSTPKLKHFLQGL